MKTITILLLALLLATSASAIIDPEPNHMGLYFDLEADLFCIDGIYLAQQLDMYLILTTPTFDALYGFEAGISTEGAADILGAEFANPQALNVGTTTNMIVGFGSPTLTQAATLLATLSVIYLDPDGNPAFFDLHGSEPSSIDPMYPVVLLADGQLMLIGTSAGSSPEGQINMCGSPVELLSFDRIKSLYR